MDECPACGGTELVELGTLGLRTHYRCRQCGAECSEVPKPEEKPKYDEGFTDGFLAGKPGVK